MLCRDIYLLAAALVNEEADIALEPCALALINLFILENNGVNAEITMTGIGEAPLAGSLDDSFPFSLLLASPCAHYVASGFVRDENSVLSEDMLERCERLIADTVGKLPCEIGAISDRYSDI